GGGDRAGGESGGGGRGGVVAACARQGGGRGGGRGGDSGAGRGLCETVRLVSKRFTETGGDVWATVERKKREFPPVPSQVTGEVEARLIALACSAPPAGHARWSLRLLEKHVALTGAIPAMDHSTIGRVLKKRNFALT